MDYKRRFDLIGCKISEQLDYRSENSKRRLIGIQWWMLSCVLSMLSVLCSGLQNT